MRTCASAAGARAVGKLSFCSQTPWILAGTVRENIIFGQPFSEERFHQVIDSCALQPDLDQFPSADGTELGEKGINLSGDDKRHVQLFQEVWFVGGQKARIALARAAYTGAHIHLLDDPLSAVDARVGRILFDK